MRTIKFRAWIENSQKMFYQGDQYLQSFLRRANQLHNPKHTGHDSYGVPLLLEFTGLLDKNEKEIYEGDIVATRVLKHSEKDLRLTQKIAYDSTLGAFVLMTGIDSVEKDFETTYNYCPIPWAHEIEIIGNIYENPDVLN